ncbi:dolichyl-diphosphooligosaccharide--protein glycosyltransferase [Toxoplasma gondii FOU]|uniref:Dolichyl-diphosphooligosaccharide--protein glycosyltransferase n=1 Tax=Toxoplasma gondii FOU TaxID=943167 RepID=A0A086K4Z1_TOXGO|nr:dolichyl-diphosphooligosaccharide--protein glycosyltransferase [Toxoplasma gondii FOU]
MRILDFQKPWHSLRRQSTSPHAHTVFQVDNTRETRKHLHARHLVPVKSSRLFFVLLSRFLLSSFLSFHIQRTSAAFCAGEEELEISSGSRACACTPRRDTQLANSSESRPREDSLDLRLDKETLEAPLLRAHAAVLPIPSAPPLRASPQGPTPVVCGSVQKRLLVLHDDPNVTENFKSLLQRLKDQNFDISTVSFPLSSGRKASLLFSHHGEHLFTHVLLLATNHRSLSRELAAALTTFFTAVDPDFEEAQAARAYAAASASSAGADECPQALKARNLFLVVSPTAHTTVHAFVETLMGVREARGTEGSNGRPGLVADFFNAYSPLQGTLEKKDAAGESEENGDASLFVAMNLLADQPHVVEPLEADEILLFRGGAHYLPAPSGRSRKKSSERESHELEQRFSVLRAPETAFVLPASGETSASLGKGDRKSGGEDESLLLGAELSLGSALQTQSGGRATLLSSGEFCSDKFSRLASEKNIETGKKKIANLRVCEELLLWTFNRRGVLRWSNLKHFKPGETVSPHMYRMKDDIVFSVDLHQLENGLWHPFYATDVQVEFVMLEPFLRFFLEPPASRQSPTFSRVFQAPDRYGVFKFVLHYNRIGFSPLHVESLAPVRNFKHNDFPRFLPCALPYYGCSLLTLIGLIVFAVLFLLHRDKRFFSPPAAPSSETPGENIQRTQLKKKEETKVA